MKKTLASLLFVGSLLVLSKPAVAANKNAIFTGFNFGEDTSYIYLGGVSALNGDIEKDGALLRVGAGYGQYKYSAPAVEGNNVRGQVSSSDLMVGYQKNFTYGRIAFYAGGNYDNYKLNKNDEGNRVVGGKSGAKGQVELWLNPLQNLVLRNVTNYTSAYNSYWSQTFAGWNFGNFVFGPEVAFLGNRSYNQQRFGLGFSDIDLGLGKLSLAGGYMKSSGKAADDGAYASVGFSSKF